MTDDGRMGVRRVMDLADELGVSTVAIVAAAEAMGIAARWAGAELSDADAERLRGADLPEQLAAAGPIPGFGGALPVAAAVAPPPVAVPAPRPTVSPPAAPPVRSPLGRRPDAMVRQGWEQWWRSIGIAVGTTLAVGFLAALLKGFANVADAYNYRDAGAPVGKVSLLVFLFLAGMAWSTLVNVRGAAAALDAWNRILESDGALKGRASITWLTFSAVCSCIALATWLIVGVVLVVLVA